MHLLLSWGKFCTCSELCLFQHKLFLDGIFVDARYRILLFDEQMEVAKIRLIKVALKSDQCSNSVSSSSSTENAAVDSIPVNDIISRPNSSSTYKNGFERESNLLERRRSAKPGTSSKTKAFDPVAQELNSNLDKMIQVERPKGENVWKIIETLEEWSRTIATIISVMAVTQVSVEWLFSSIRFIFLHDQMSPNKQDQLKPILLLLADGNVAET